MEFTTVIVNSTVEFPFENSTLSQIPYFEGRLGQNKLSINCPLEVEYRHLVLISKIVRKMVIIPTIDAISHLDVLSVIRLAKFFGISMETLSEGFAGWTEHRKWIDLWYPEYMYLIYVENEDLVDFRKFFRLHKNPFESVSKATLLHDVRKNAELYIEMLLFFKNFNFTMCFDQNNDKVQDRITSLNKEREAIWEIFMVNPHAEFLTDYFKFVPTNYPIWDSNGISVIKMPEAGEQTLAPFETARNRMKEFTHSMLDIPLNPNVTKPFPFANVIFAGGAVTKILGADYNKKNARQSDADLFIVAKSFEERSRVFEEVINWFRTYNVTTEITTAAKTYYALRGSVTTIYIKDIARKFQVISINKTNPYEVIARFDLTHIQWCAVNGQFFGTPEACRSMRERITRFNNTHRLRTERLIKALHCGYSILKEQEVIEKHIDITELIGDPNSLQLQKYKRDLYGWYYPQSIPDMEPEEETQHILCMIEKDSNATLVTNDPNFVINNVTIGGNFENDYESMLYSTFNPASIMNRVQNRRVNRVLLRSKHGAIRLTTSILKVRKVITTDNGIEIRARPEDETFREFCNMLEGQVFRMFRNGGVSRHILNDEGDMTFNVPRYRLDQQNTRGISCMRSQRGAALNIEEDLKEGDDLQILFLLEIVMFPEERAVDLKPVKFVKYQKYDPEAAAKVQAVNEDIEKEIERLAQETEFVGEIKYEEDNIL